MDVSSELLGPFGITVACLIAMVMITRIVFHGSESKHRAGIVDAVLSGFAEIIRALTAFLKALPEALGAAMAAVRQYFGTGPSDGPR